MRVQRVFPLLGVFLLLAGCRSLPESQDYIQPVSLAQRQFQTRLYEAEDDNQVLRAGIAVLLDNGFQINQVESRLGWVHAYKHTTTPTPPGWVWLFYATVVTGPVKERPGVTQVRVTFHEGRAYAREGWGFHLVDRPVVYQAFFDRLSKALFLEAQRI